MTDRELKLILSEARSERRGGAPHEDWVTRNRGILMMQVRNAAGEPAESSLLQVLRDFVSVFVPAERLMLAARSFAVFALVIGSVFGGGLASVMAYRGAAPGSLGYQVKLAVEKAQVTMAPNEIYRIRLHAEFADRRLDEAAKLSEGPVASRRQAVAVLTSFNDELASLRGGLESIRSVDPEGVAMAAKLLDRKMVSYRQVMREVVRSLPSDVRPQALAVVGQVEGIGLQAVAVLLEQHLAGDANATKETVAGKIEDRIRQAEAKLTVAAERPATQRSARATAAIAEAKEMLKAENYQAAFSKMVEVVELTADDLEDIEAEEEEREAAEAADSEGEEGGREE